MFRKSALSQSLVLDVCLPVECNVLGTCFSSKCSFLDTSRISPVLDTEVGGSATCSGMRISATCGTRKFAAEMRFNPQAADYGIAPAH
jgi:hypothetical protein